MNNVLHWVKGNKQLSQATEMVLVFCVVWYVSMSLCIAKLLTKAVTISIAKLVRILLVVMCVAWSLLLLSERLFCC